MEFYSATKNEILSFAGKWMELKNILSEVSQAQKQNIICSPSYADYRSKTNAIILLNMCHTLRENMHRRNRERKGNLKLDVVDGVTV
jgi:hypothetical protein